jgi:hypothetical protein
MILSENRFPSPIGVEDMLFGIMRGKRPPRRIGQAKSGNYKAVLRAALAMRCQNFGALQQTPRVKRFEPKNLFRGHPMRARVFDQRVVVDRHDRSEIAMRDPLLAGELGDVV